MSSSNDILTEEPDILSSSSSEERQSEERTTRHDPPFVSLPEFRAQAPNLAHIRARYLRGEISYEEWIAGIHHSKDHVDALKERKRAFEEREQRGEVTRAERQREYGWTDEELQAIRDNIRMCGDVIAHNVARCKDRNVLYRSSRGH